MTDPRLLTYSLRELQDHLREELARNPFLADKPRIASGAEVRVQDGTDWITGTVMEYRNGEYAVRLPGGRTLGVSGPVLERNNPDVR